MAPRALGPLAGLFLLLVAGVAMARDLTLAEAERMLLAHNRDLAAARRAVEAADAQLDIAAARPNPTVSLDTTSLSASPGIGPGALNQKRADTVLRIEQPFERGGKRELRIAAAGSLQQAARSDSLEAQRAVLAQLRSAYFELKLAQEKLAVLQESAELFTGTLRAAQRRLKAGDLAPAEVAKIQVDHERAQNEARAAGAELARARFALAFLIGAEAAAGALRAADPWPAPAGPGPGEVAAALAAAESRPDVAAARARVAAAEKLRDLALSQRTRDITLGAQVERYPGSVPVNSIGFGISFPLFTGNDFSGEIRRAEAERYAALDALERARAVAANDVRRAGSDLAAAADRLARYDGTLVAAAERSAQAAEFAFQRGATSVLEVLDARRTLRAVRMEALSARAEHAIALAAWQASRGPTQSAGEEK